MSRYNRKWKKNPTISSISLSIRKTPICPKRFCRTASLCTVTFLIFTCGMSWCFLTLIGWGNIVDKRSDEGVRSSSGHLTWEILTQVQNKRWFRQYFTVNELLHPYSQNTKEWAKNLPTDELILLFAHLRTS